MSGFFYVKKSLGQNFKEIDIYKIRTMNSHADDLYKEIVLEGRLNSLGNPIFDPRVTKLGKFLRDYRIDELPQLYNLVKCDIKLVGVRPLKKEFWNLYSYEFISRVLKHKPGLLAIQGAVPLTLSFDNNVNLITKYLDKYEKNPVKTDVEYFRKIIYNIVTGKLKGS
jgi:lipopolysaccharide/colanic/teichoic acid biosynthesis glycosyltransferase